MRLLALTATLAAAVAGPVACARSDSSTVEACAKGKAVTSAAAPPQRPLLAVMEPIGGDGMLGRFDPLTLKPVSRQVSLGEYHDNWSVSPDGSHAAFGLSASGKNARVGVRIVDLATLEVVRELEVGIAAEALAWLTPQRLVAALQDSTVLVDPDSGRVIRRWRAFAFPDASARTRHALVILFGAPLGSTGQRPARLATVDARGRLRSVTLDRVRVGRGGADRAGLAVDDAGARAYVAAADAPIAEVDLATMDVTYRLEPSEPEVDADTLRGRQRRVLWLGGGKIAVVGRDQVGVLTRPGGATLIDTRDWTACTLDERASAAALAAGWLLLHAPGAFGSRDQPGIGLRAYRVDDGTRFHLLGDAPIWDVDAVGHHAYVRTADGLKIVDVEAGAVVAIVPGAPALGHFVETAP
jgi:hypothetical protein